MGIFDFFKSDNKKQLTSIVSTDIHSHLLPGIDDGVKTIEEAVSLIKSMKELGFSRLITTPHIRADVYPNTHEIIKSKLDEVKTALQNENIDIKFEAAAEYYVDDSFMDLIKKEKLLTFGKDNYLLIEFSYFNKPMYVKPLIFDLQSMGYKVVLAHPERYSYFHHQSELFTSLVERDVLLQLNITSLTKFYDASVSKMAQKLINEGLYTFVGSDLHNEQYMRALKSSIAKDTYLKIFQKCTIMNDMI